VVQAGLAVHAADKVIVVRPVVNVIHLMKVQIDADVKGFPVVAVALAEFFRLYPQIFVLENNISTKNNITERAFVDSKADRQIESFSQ
jgi:hypothetical protein